MGETPNLGIPYPNPGDIADLSGDLQKIAEKIDSLGGDGLRLLTTVHYPTTGSFVLSNYPGIKAVKVICQGAGGGGGGCQATGSSQRAEGAGGGSGGWSLRWIGVDSLSGSTSVSVGAGGAGSAGNGGSGGGASFGGFLTTSGGTGGEQGTATTGQNVRIPGEGGTASGGDINIFGQRGSCGLVIAGYYSFANNGGDSRFGNGGRANASINSTGFSPNGYGSGASGARSGPNQTARVSNSGRPGLVIVEVYV